MSYYRQGPFRPGGPGVRLGVPALTPVVKKLVIACCAVWFVQFVQGALGAGTPLHVYLGASLPGILSGMIWQPVTYMFLHSPMSPFHLLFNMLMLWMFGGELERHWGGRAFLRYYVVCGIGGGLVAPILGIFPGSNPSIPTIGASGAIFGLFAAYGMVFAERVILFMLIFPMKARTMAIIMFALNFFYLFSNAGGGVAYLAHLGGGFTGLLYLKRVWRVGELFREIRWKIQRRRFKVMPPPDDPDRWIN